MTAAVKKYLSSLANEASWSRVCGISAIGTIGYKTVSSPLRSRARMSRTHEKVVMMPEERIGQDDKVIFIQYSKLDQGKVLYRGRLLIPVIL